VGDFKLPKEDSSLTGFFPASAEATLFRRRRAATAAAKFKRVIMTFYLVGKKG
jgi:hypothetical protein